MGDETGSWAREELAVLTTVPEYGSVAWHGLEPGDPRRQGLLWWRRSGGVRGRGRVGDVVAEVPGGLGRGAVGVV